MRNGANRLAQELLHREGKVKNPKFTCRNRIFLVLKGGLHGEKGKGEKAWKEKQIGLCHQQS